jgi:lipoprotein LpqH
MIGVASAAVAAGVVTGCSSGYSNDPSTSTSTSAATASGPGASGAATVLIDGQAQNVSGPVICSAAESDINVTIGDGAAGVGAVISNGSPPVVHSVRLGHVNGVALGYADAVPGHGTASASKTGNAYKITGTAVDVGASNPQQVTKSFELDFTCP